MTPMPKILIAPNPFKGTLTAAEAAAAIQQGLSAFVPDASLQVVAISDGGDGFLDMLQAADTSVSQRGGFFPGADFRPIRAPYLVSTADRTAYVEMAKICGLARLSRPAGLRGSTYGLGCLLDKLAAAGYRQIVLGLGGSATNDAGLGAFLALGGDARDRRGKRVSPDAAGLLRLRSIRRLPQGSAARKVRLQLVCDVRAPLTGRKGATLTYGPQKGIPARRLHELDRAVGRFFRLAKRLNPQLCRHEKRVGAAGGVAVGLSLAFDVRLCSGFAWASKRIGLGRRIAESDVVITGEGRFDLQSFQGKGPYRIAQLAKRNKKLVLAIFGAADPRALSKAQGLFDAVFITHPDPAKPQPEKREAKKRLVGVAKGIGRLLTYRK